MSQKKRKKKRNYKLVLYPKRFRVHLVGWVEKWEDRKLWNDEKVREWKIFYFFSFLFSWEWKS